MSPNGDRFVPFKRRHSDLLDHGGEEGDLDAAPGASGAARGEEGADLHAGARTDVPVGPRVELSGSRSTNPESWGVKREGHPRVTDGDEEGDRRRGLEVRVYPIRFVYGKVGNLNA